MTPMDVVKHIPRSPSDIHIKVMIPDGTITNKGKLGKKDALKNPG